MRGSALANLSAIDHQICATCKRLPNLPNFPELAWLLVPFTLLVAASRVVLGLHYPSDVLAGAALGATIALSAQRLWPGLG